MISKLLQECLLKGGFLAKIPENVGKKDILDGQEVFVTFNAQDPTFNSAFLLEIPKNGWNSLWTKISKFFSEYDVPFSISLSEISSDPLLQSHVEAEGFAEILELSCMVLEKSEWQENTPPTAWHISLCEDKDRLVNLYVGAYPLPRDEAEIMVNTLEVLGFQNYVAQLGNDTPASVGTLCIFTDALGGRIAYLGGAATLPSARGKGAYRALLSERIRNAFMQGCDAVVVQANPHTSMASCVSLGFKKVDTLRMYARKSTT